MGCFTHNHIGTKKQEIMQTTEYSGTTKGKNPCNGYTLIEQSLLVVSIHLVHGKYNFHYITSNQIRKSTTMELGLSSSSPVTLLMLTDSDDHYQWSLPSS